MSVFHHGSYIGDVARGRNNNLNIIRMIAASAVLVSHAYPLSLGPDTIEPLEIALRGTTLGSVAVSVFFGISGFLIAKSFETSPSAGRYWLARTLRLFPALLVALCLTVLVAGFFITTAPAAQFWARAPIYILRNLTLFKLEYQLPGTFIENPYGPAINGSLWTLSYEFACYTALFFFGSLGLLRGRSRLLTLAVAYSLFYIVVSVLDPHPRLTALNDLGLPFAVGTLFYILRARVFLHYGFAVLGLACALALRDSILAREAFVIGLIYATFVIAYLPGGPVRLYNGLGDYSYGMYIYAFPIQQLIARAGVETPLGNIALSFPITLVLAVISWHIIEKPALSLIKRSPAPEAVSKMR